MFKVIAGIVAGAAMLFASATFAQDTNAKWSGKLYDIMPTHEGITDDYCKSHVLDTYETSASMVDKEVRANNGVMARDVSYKNKQMGQVWMQEGKATFSGTTDGKEWKDKVYFYAYGLNKDSKMTGVWYTKDCKGFYEVGPQS